MRLLTKGVVVLALLLWVAGASADKAQEATGTAPPGAYTFPANFSNGRAPAAGRSVLGIEITRGQLTNPATQVELVVEVSWDRGTTWPPDCLPPPAVWCHDSTQQLPPNTDWMWIRTRGDPNVLPGSVSSQRVSFGRLTDNDTRVRERLRVVGAPATGTVSVIWE